jgi:thymidylate synthase ThyX
MNNISAKIVADSKNKWGQRLTSFILIFPRIVLAEFNTHRMFTRNSASSRAIPSEKMIKMVEEEPFIPIKWMKEHKGMQGTEYITDEKEIDFLEYQWKEAGRQAVKSAQNMSGRGLTKQICNRLLEPFMWHTVILTATELENFFALRAHGAAEIHIQELAHKMLEEYNKSEPKLLNEGEWHIPFGDSFDDGRIAFLHADGNIQDLKVKIATARCARVSYLNFEGKDDYDADIKLHNRLLESGHMSPFEHCAKAMGVSEMKSWEQGKGINEEKANRTGNTHYVPFNKSEEGWCGNFRGFIQYRKMIEGENKSDSRVIKK